MRNFLFCGLLVALAVGCGAEDEPSGTCAMRPETSDASYRATFYETSGNCGPLPTVVFDGDEPEPENCSSADTISEDNCRVGEQGTCVNSETGITGHFHGVCIWNSAGTEADCVYDYEFSGAMVCSSTYDATLDRLR